MHRSSLLGLGIGRGPLAVVAAVAVVLVGGCDKKSAGGPPAGKRNLQFPVAVEQVDVRPVEYAVRAVGTIDVFERVQVVARVAGAVEKVAFREGQEVKANTVLVTIDPARFTLAARDAEASAGSAEAARAEADSGLSRRSAADQSNPGLIPGEEIESWRTKLSSAQADLAQRKVAIDRARLDLRDAFVRAPISGVIQTRTVETGQYVQPGTTLATLVRREPLLLRFDVSEAEAAKLHPDMSVRFSAESVDGELTAKVNHVAEVADSTSRMVRVTAQIDDPRRNVLRAGGFAQVTAPIATARPAPVIPETAVRPSERGFLAYVVEGNVARERVVELGLRTADGRVEVKTGLRGGETLVVRGAEALRDGAPVKIGDVPEGRGAGGQGAHGDKAGKPTAPSATAPSATAPSATAPSTAPAAPKQGGAP